MRLGSLFDGIGGFPLAATFHGITPVWASEIEPFPIEVTKARFPGMKHLGDITQINGAEIEPVDIVTFGSPCQDLSIAGKRDGLEGKRSNLFFEAVRIIREMRRATDGRYPRFALWENVPGAFSSNGGADFRAVLEEITEAEIPMPHTGRWATAGMVRGGKCEVAWRVLDAQYWGVPQRRRRIFLVADFAGQRAGEILFECEGVPGDIAESGKARQEVAAGAGNGAEGTSWAFSAGQSAKAGSLGFAEEVSPTLRAGASGTNMTPTVVANAYTVRMREGCAGGGKGPLISEDKSLTLGCSNDQTLIAGTVSAKWAKGSGGPAGDECQNLVAFAVRTANTGANGHGIAEDKAHTLDQAQGQAVAQLCENHGQDSRLNGPLMLQPDARGFRAVAFTPSQFGQYQEGVGTLRSSGGDYGGGSENLVSNNYTVRRLTPTECERLQGFPDGWTSIEGASDTGRYKALGNSVAIPCVAWIMKRIKEVTHLHFG